MKAESLKKLRKAGFNVPKFIIIDAVDDIDEKIKHLDKDALYAVRSSCVIEDSLLESHAGEFDTFLNQSYSHIKECVSQIRESYMKKNQPGSVIVQLMVDSAISGVVFTANPVGILNEAVVVAGYGLGSNVVDNRVSTSTYYYNLDDKICYCERHGKPGDSPSLKFEAVERLVNTALKIKKYFKYDAVDIEYAVDNDNKLYILQARPVTTLSINPDTTMILDNSNIVESYPGVTLPLTQDFVKLIYSDVFKTLVSRLESPDSGLCIFGNYEPSSLRKRMEQTLNSMVESVNGRMYYNISSWYSVLGLLPFSDHIIKIWQKMLGVQNIEVTKHTPELSRSDKSKIMKSFRNLYHTNNENMEKLGKLFEQSIGIWRSRLDESNSVDSLVELFKTMEKSLTSCWDITLVNDMYTFINVALVKDKEGIHGVKDIQSKKPDIMFRMLVEKTRGVGIDSKEYKHWKKVYIDKFGDRVPEELKLETKTYRTNPELLDERIIKELGNTDDLAVVRKENIKQSSGGVIERRAKQGIANRETSRMNRTIIFGLARSVMLKIGEILEKEGYLKDSRDVFYMQLDEIEGHEYEEADYRNNIAWRKHLYKSYETIPCISRWVFSDGIVNKTMPISSTLSDTSDLHGTIVSSFAHIVTGEAVVVTDAKAVSAEDVTDKIVIAEYTDPGWVFIMRECNGIICERGSLLSHTAILAREMDKMCIVNVRGATKAIKTGDIVEVDCETGRITVTESRGTKQNDL